MTTANRYTKEALAEAARLCSNIEEVIARLGTRPYSRLASYLLKRFADHGIDVSHFPAVGRPPRPTAAELRHAVDASRSLSESLRILGRPDNHHQRARLKAWIADEGLSTAHFLGQAHQRGKPSPTAKTPDEILVRHDRQRRTGTKTLRRALHEIGVPECCDRCGTPPEWTGRPMTLEIDHVNGDWSDDRRENLRLLCPNCHAITSTWCRGGPRRSSS
ncbi:HNH endonuclease [Streptomyces sp. NBC_01006]|uniref:HNH endonuclease signature motif containing protein n=1 Tax=Streptomyces sp. NBC_01006 TaxID=2903716 RepID=UPI00386D49BE|nr:HNH endonuclease [Streptomyces sp. NBC_01006]